MLQGNTKCEKGNICRQGAIATYPSWHAKQRYHLSLITKPLPSPLSELEFGIQDLPFPPSAW